MRTIALIVAVALGIVAALGVRSYLKKQERQYEQQYREVDVAAAGRSIDAGEELTRDMIAFQKKPQKSLSSLDIVRLDVDRYLGRKVNRNIDRGSQIMVSDFTRRRPESAARALPDGMRAMSINVDAVTGVSGLINPGDSVDILATITEGEGRAKLEAASVKTMRVLSDVTVLAVDNRMSATSNSLDTRRGYGRNYANLTLAVTPMESQLLVYLQEHATLTFVLRPQTEVGQEGELPEVSASNVTELAKEANKERQRRIEEVEKVPATGQ